MPRKPISLILLVLFALMLSGCVTAQVNLTVNPDNSGTFGISMGVSKQLLALAGGDLSDVINGELGNEVNGQTVQTRRWSEGDTEWVESSFTFNNFDQLDQFIKNTSLFDKFTLEHQRGILKDTFILDAQIGALSDQMPDSDNNFGLFDPADMLTFQLIATLPGEVTQTNGVFLGKMSEVMVWDIKFDRPTRIHAESEVWSWVNIGIIGVSTFVLFILGIIVLVMLIRGMRKRKRASVRESLGT